MLQGIRFETIFSKLSFETIHLLFAKDNENNDLIMRTKWSVIIVQFACSRYYM